MFVSLCFRYLTGMVDKRTLEKYEREGICIPIEGLDSNLWATLKNEKDLEETMTTSATPAGQSLQYVVPVLQPLW